MNMIETCDDINLKYQLGNILEEGPYGKIYSATNLKTRQEVILKMVKKNDLAFEAIKKLKHTI